jgi:lysophospholipase L1-like esterase
MIVMLGINNSWAAEQPATESIYQGVLTNLRALHARKPESRIVLQSLLPTNDSAKNKELVMAVNKRLETLVGNSEFSNYTVYLNLYPSFTDSSGVQISNYFTDGLHPNDTGYQVWRDRLIEFLKQIRSVSKNIVRN